MKYPTIFDFPGKSSFTAQLILTITIFAALVSLPFLFSARSQTRPRTTSTNANSSGVPDETVKVDVDLVTIDALVLDKKTARVVGDLAKDDFVLSEDASSKRSRISVRTVCRFQCCYWWIGAVVSILSALKFVARPTMRSRDELQC